jgi:hypothetical protein
METVTRDDGVTASEALADLLSVFHFADDDPRRTMSAVAVRLAREFDARPVPAVARELRAVMGVMLFHPNEPADKLDELQARRLARRVDLLVRAEAGQP